MERPIYKRIYTGNERGRQWYDKRTGTAHIDYSDAFDDILWEYAQGEADAAKKDEFTYAEWFINTRGEFSTGGANFGQAPPSNISAETAEKYKTRLLETLKGNFNQSLLKQYVNHIMIETRNSARGVGVERARTNPVVEDAMSNPAYRAWRGKVHRGWF